MSQNTLTGKSRSESCATTPGQSCAAWNAETRSRADDPVGRARRTSVLQHTEATFDPLPFDAEAARAFGLITGAVLAIGRTTRRRIADLMIASVAHANRLALYSTDPDGRYPPSTLHRVAHDPDWSADPARVSANVAGRGRRGA
ncbi:hypothetical protein KIF24_07845 [Micromonospora sp. Llam7]|uniref:hypothetical protein n=1 Tax=Micromonospora tarapacensis TaxID=2835305 RepID=UPI001C82E203|nr:hypothetical protein [Micromonospora tarapacensis]MBX7265952.1 hypothetical protein [Micromonospora tarapacensis]